MNNLTTVDLPAERPRPNWEAIMQAEGDSMAPTFTSGDLLEVDRRVNDYRGDAIYVFTLDDQLYVKSLQMVPDGTLNVISRNPLCGNFRLSLEEQQRMQVLGRVVKIWNGNRV